VDTLVSTKKKKALFMEDSSGIAYVWPQKLLISFIKRHMEVTLL
jgi:hypothetical protein